MGGKARPRTTFIKPRLMQSLYQCSFLACEFFLKGVAWLGPPLRMSDEHGFIVRVP